MNESLRKQEMMTAICEKVFDKNCIPFDMGKIRSKCRNAEHVFWRSVCVMALRSAGFTKVSIGKLLNIHHATVIHYVNTYNMNSGKFKNGWRVLIPKPEDKEVVLDKIAYHEDELKRLKIQLA